MSKSTDQAKREKEIRANWISSEGKFATDDFIAQLLSSKAPKLMHDQLRQANYNFAEGEGKRSTTARPISQTTTKVKSSKTTITEEVVKQHFPKALPETLITSGLIEWLEDEMLFTSRQTLHANCICAGDKPLKFANAEICFLGQHVALGGVAGLPLVESCKVTSKRASLYGCKMVVTYQSHCSVSANGTFDYIELDDKGTDIRIETQCCQPAITALNKVIFAQQMQSKTESGENLNTPKKPTVSVKMSAPKPLDLTVNKESEASILCDILMKQELRLRHTAKPPLIELPQILYEEIRNRLIQTMVPLIDIPTLFIGSIHIHTPPEIPDYYYVINVDLLRARAVRNRSNKNETESSKNDDGTTGTDENIPTPRSVYDSDSQEDSEDDEDENETKTDIIIEDNPFVELDCHLSQFYRCISKRIIAFEAKMRGTKAVKQGIETATDRRNKRKKQKEEANRYAAEKSNDDWGISKDDDADVSKRTVAEQKIGKWFVYFRWSRLVRRIREEVKASETADDWGIDRSATSEQKSKKKMGAFFMTLRWNRLVKKALRVHERKERREELHYY